MPVPVLVLGTGSKHAARVYSKDGFHHLLGGLSEATKGYNPDDEGGWMMVRRVSQGSIVPFLPGDFHDKSCTAGGGRFPRVFGDKFGEEFCDKFGDEFSESPNLVMN